MGLSGEGASARSLSEEALAKIAAAKKRIISRENPLLSDLPDWVREWRPWQKDAIKEIVDAFEEVDVVVLDAPTGSGKTLIAETVRRMVGGNTVYACSTIDLQEQFVKDFPYGQLVKGRSNYPVISDKIHSAADCTWSSDRPRCRLCPSKSVCPYEIAKMSAYESDLAVLNTAYLLTEGNGPGKFRGRRLIVVDEADLLESELMRFVGIEIGARAAKEYGIEPPKKVTVASSWVEWKDSVVPRLREYRKRLDRDTQTQKWKRVDSLIRKLANADFVEGWVYTGKDNYISFKPVRVDDHAKDLLWPLGKKFLLMSATVISAGVLLDELGWEKGYKVVNVPSTFAVENRRVNVRPAANMTRKLADNTSMANAISDLLKFHQGEKVLVHTVSYDLANMIATELEEWYLAPDSSRKVFTYRNSGDKVHAVKAFKESEEGVLIAPSLERGLDLPDDLCRVQIIAKVPYPYLGDRQVNARLHSSGGQVWYNVQTVRSIVQMTGRGVRHKDDFAVTYILDEQFTSLWNKARGLFPKWWTDALNWRR